MQFETNNTRMVGWVCDVDMNEAGGTTATVEPSLYHLRYLMKLHKFKESPKYSKETCHKL